MFSLKIPSGLKIKIENSENVGQYKFQMNEDIFIDIEALLDYLDIGKEGLIAIKNGVAVNFSESIEENDYIILYYMMLGG